MKYYAPFEKPKREIVVAYWDLRDLVYGPFRTYSTLFSVKPEERVKTHFLCEFSMILGRLVNYE